MHFKTTSAAIALAAALAAAPQISAHVVLENPKPFKWANDGHYNPLEPDGSDFPCKKYPGQTLEVDGERTVMAIGEIQTASFQGLAVHGGGSCQFSLTRDLQPTPDSEWVVIHSIEGGCPARHQPGNVLAETHDRYDFTIPASVGTGLFTFSWTWNNRIAGSPEFYQNCAPITVVAAGESTTTTSANGSKRRTLKKERVVASAANLPQLFLANLGGLTGGCTTNDAVTQHLAIAYPNPGSSVERPEGDVNLFQQPCDGNPRAPPGGGGSDNPGQPGTTATSTSVAATVPPEPTSTATVTAEPPAVTVTKTTSTFITSTTASPPAVVPSSEDSTPTETTTGIAPDPTGGVCVEGHLTCMADGLGFKTCTGGILRPENEAVPVPPGNKCTPGSGVGLDLHQI